MRNGDIAGRIADLYWMDDGASIHEGWKAIDFGYSPQFPYLILQLIQLTGDGVALDGDHGDRARDDILAIWVDAIGLKK